MGEIKSTLELAMERTKKMTISEKEKQEIKRKEIEQKVNSLSNRYIAGHLSLNEILRETERMDENTQAKAIEILLSQWIDALSLSDEDERLIKGIESLKHRDAEELKQKHLQLLSRYRCAREKAREEVGTRFVETLKKKGIYGSAVEPNIEASPLWKKEVEILDQQYCSQVQELKEQLRTL